MTRIVLLGRGHRIHTGKIPKKIYDRLDQESEMSDDGTVDVWDYIDDNIAYGVAPGFCQLLIDDVVVATDLDELAVKFKLTSHPHEKLMQRTEKKANLILIEHEKGEWANLEIDNFNPELLNFELRTLIVPNGITYQIITGHYNNEFIKEPFDLIPKGVTHYFVGK